jgi:hypothetical protein
MEFVSGCYGRNWTSRHELETSEGTYSINASTAQHLPSSCYFEMTFRLLHTSSPSHSSTSVGFSPSRISLPRRRRSFLTLAHSPHLSRRFALVTLLSPLAVLLALPSFRRSRWVPHAIFAGVAVPSSYHSLITALPHLFTASSFLRGFSSTLFCRCHDGSLRTAIIEAFWPFPTELVVWLTLLPRAESLQQLA